MNCFDLFKRLQTFHVRFSSLLSVLAIKLVSSGNNSKAALVLVTKLNAFCGL